MESGRRKAMKGVGKLIVGAFWGATTVLSIFGVIRPPIKMPVGEVDAVLALSIIGCVACGILLVVFLFFLIADNWE
jgi:hypothetical protein